MGRRAKNKQAPPAALYDSSNAHAHPPKPSSKRSGKRKAPEGDIVEKTDGRPAKKAKGKSSVLKGKNKNIDSEDEGWEDVDGEDDIKTQAKYVYMCCKLYSMLTRI